MKVVTCITSFYEAAAVVHGSQLSTALLSGQSSQFAPLCNGHGPVSDSREPLVQSLQLLTFCVARHHVLYIHLA